MCPRQKSERHTGIAGSSANIVSSARIGKHNKIWASITEANSWVSWDRPFNTENYDTLQK